MKKQILTMLLTTMAFSNTYSYAKEKVTVEVSWPGGGQLHKAIFDENDARIHLKNEQTFFNEVKKTIEKYTPIIKENVLQKKTSTLKLEKLIEATTARNSYRFCVGFDGDPLSFSITSTLVRSPEFGYMFADYIKQVKNYQATIRQTNDLYLSVIDQIKPGEEEKWEFKNPRYVEIVKDNLKDYNQESMKCEKILEQIIERNRKNWKKKH